MNFRLYLPVYAPGLDNELHEVDEIHEDDDDDDCLMRNVYLLFFSFSSDADGTWPHMNQRTPPSRQLSLVPLYPVSAQKPAAARATHCDQHGPTLAESKPRGIREPPRRPLIHD